MKFTGMVEITVAVPEKEKILNELERINKLYPYTDLSEAWDTAYDYALSKIGYDLVEKILSSDIIVKISNYIDLVIYDFSAKHPEIAIKGGN